MTISTSYFYDRSVGQLGRLGDGADRLQTQISTGKKLIKAADDAAGYQRLAGIRRDSADAKQASANVGLAQGLLAQTDSALAGVEEQLQRASELAIQAANGTLTADNREAIALSLDSILDDLVSLGNTRDVRGQPLFGGTSESAAFTTNADGTVSYTGGGDPAAIPIGDGREVIATENGARVFSGQGGGTDLFATISALAAAVRSGDSAAIGTSSETVKTTLGQIGSARASVGARAVRLDLEQDQAVDAATAREIERSSIEDVDLSSAITELQKTLTVLQAAQASFTRLSQLSLFNDF